MLSDAAYAVILDSDPAMRLSLRHMFSVICGLDCEVFSEPEVSQEYLAAHTAPKLIVIGRVSMDRATLLSNILGTCDSFIVAIDRQDIPHEGEEAFLSGAHDVIRPPFTLREFALRLRARVGLLSGPAGEALLQDTGNWDHEAYIAGRAGLTDAEAQIAHILISHSGEIVSRDVLSHAIDGRAWDYGDRKFDVHVAKIRKKLTTAFGEHISVQTVRSAGYVLTIDDQGHNKLFGERAPVP